MDILIVLDGKKRSLSLWMQNSWKRFNKTKIATKKEFYSNVNAENITYEKNFREILN